MKPARTYINLWEEGVKYNDNVSHFMRMDLARVQRYFGVDGVFAAMPNSPNWLESTNEGYEMVRVAHDNSIESRTGFFININAVDLEGRVVDPAKGNVVGFWNYHTTIPNLNETDRSLKIGSDDGLKTIIAYGDGSIYANACKFTGFSFRKEQKSTLIINTIDGTVYHTPFVNLAFFMFLEDTEEGKALHRWLIEKRGWPDATPTQ